MGAEMAEARTYYDSEYYKGLTWWFVRDEIGRGLRERYQLPKELPPKLLALVRKLDAIEGNYLLRYAPPLERRSVGESDWLPPRLVWQNDADLFGGEGNGRLAREVAMNSPLLVVIIVIAVVVGSTLSTMNKACKSGYHAWCAPMSMMVRHHVKPQPPA